MTQERILIVEDEANERTGLAELVSSWGYRTDTAADGVEALEKVSVFSPSIVITDIKMPRMDGMELVEKLADLSQSIAVVMVTAQKTTETAFHAGRLGVQDYIEKPIDFRRLRSILGNLGEILQTRNENESLRRSLRDKGALGRLVGSSPKMLEIFHLVEMVAPSTASVLITGASGTGKELVARTIHDMSPRRNKPFFPINCAAIPETLIESEIFGHEKGAFTGAVERRTGCFELAEGGTLLLDEIGEMTPHLQAKLLHVLQDSEYSRLGGKRMVHVDAHVLASTNINLEEAVANGKFRDDLYFRLNVIRVDIPPLRERREDIPMLCSYFMCRYRDRYKSVIEEISPALLDSFLRYDWPGNVRQLENAIKRYLILPDMNANLSELNEPLQSNVAVTPVKPKEDKVSLKDVGARAAEQAERELVLRVLEETSWNRKQAALRLNICYKALLNKLKRWQIDNRQSIANTFNKPQSAGDFQPLPF